MKKKILAVLLIFSLVMPVIVQMGLLFHHKKEIRDSLEEILEKEDLVYFEFTKQEIQTLEWEHEQEFKFKGDMYDVVQREQKGDKYILWCYKDDFERELKKKINHFLAHGFNDDIQNDKQKKNLSHFFSGLFFQNTQFKLQQFSFIINTFIPKSFQVLNTDISAVDPPPKLS